MIANLQKCKGAKLESKAHLCYDRSTAISNIAVFLRILFDKNCGCKRNNKCKSINIICGFTKNAIYSLVVNKE